MPWAELMAWFFGCSGLLVLNKQYSGAHRRLRVSHVDENTGLTWVKGLGAGESPAYEDDARRFKGQVLNLSSIYFQGVRVRVTN